MVRHAYERLSDHDSACLQAETASLPMHTSTLQIFEAGPLAAADGGIDFAKIRDLIASKLHRMPRLRQRLLGAPDAELTGWVDDEHFRIENHLRHVSLPRPGSDEQLATLASHAMALPLDRAHPLWETWVVEGLSGGRFALIHKQHHSATDGSVGTPLMSSLLEPEPSDRIGAIPPFHPRPAPSPAELQRSARWRKLAAPLRTLQAAADFARDSRETGRELRAVARAVRDLATSSGRPALASPINGPVGSRRRFETVEMPLDLVMDIRRALRCDDDEVVLTIVAGALREFMIERRVSPDDLDFRVRTADRVVRLPLGEANPLERARAIREEMRTARATSQSDASLLLSEGLRWLPFDLPTAATRAAHSVNCVVSNLHGPPSPLYLLGARQLALFPQLPLAAGQRLSIGAMSYDGLLCWGLYADADPLADLPELAVALRRALEQLAEASGIRSSEPARPPKKRPPEPASRGPIETPHIVWPASENAPRTPSELRRTVLAQHAELSKLLDTVAAAARRVQGGDGSVLDLLRDCGRELHERMSEHLDYEDRWLVPAMRELDAWGTERARSIDEEHRDQRELLSFVLSRLEDRKAPVQLLADQLLSFVAAMRDDMQFEEAAVLREDLLRDDVVSVGATSG